MWIESQEDMIQIKGNHYVIFNNRPCGVDQLVEYPYIYFANPS